MGSVLLYAREKFHREASYVIEIGAKLNAIATKEYRTATVRLRLEGFLFMTRFTQYNTKEYN